MKRTVYIITLSLLTLAACSKSPVETVPSPASAPKLTVHCPVDALSKAYFEDESSGNLKWRWDEFSIAGIPVSEDPLTGEIALQYENAILGNRETTSSWGSDRNYFYCETDKTPFEFFAGHENDKLVFLMVAHGEYWEYGQFYVSYDGYSGAQQFIHYEETEPGNYSSSPENLTRFWNLPYNGADHYCFATAVSNYQYDYIEKRENTYSGRAYERCQTICGYSSPVTLDDVIANGYSVSFKGFKLANAMLFFNVQLDGMTDFSMYSLDVSIRNDADHSMEDGWYHQLAGPTYTFFSVADDTALPSGEYQMKSVPELCHEWDCTVEDLKPVLRMTKTGGDSWSKLWNHIYDYPEGCSKIQLKWDYADDNVGWITDYGYPLTLTPSEHRFPVIVLPQSDFIDADSYLLFEAKDQQGNVVAIAKKTLPTGGFQAGKRYDFTLTLRENDLGTDAGNAGSYGVGTL